jgi:hypothetical protein
MTRGVTADALRAIVAHMRATPIHPFHALALTSGVTLLPPPRVPLTGVFLLWSYKDLPIPEASILHRLKTFDAPTNKCLCGIVRVIRRKVIAAAALPNARVTGASTQPSWTIDPSSVSRFAEYQSTWDAYSAALKVERGNLSLF